MSKNIYFGNQTKVKKTTASSKCVSENKNCRAVAIQVIPAPLKFVCDLQQFQKN